MNINKDDGKGGFFMISIGIDASKGKSTVCILKPYGEVVKKPFIVEHTKESLNELILYIQKLEGEKRIFIEATGIYHLPINKYLLEMNFSVTTVNPLTMYKYASLNIRPGKTDRLDAVTIANYGIDNWFKPNVDSDNTIVNYNQLRFLSRQYNQYINMRVKCRLSLLNITERTMPNIDRLLENDSQNIKRDKFNSFVARFIHYDNISCLTEKQFISDYKKWAKKEGYQQSERKAKQIYAIAIDSIPTLSSKDPSVKMLTLEAIRTYREISTSTDMIISQMIETSKKLKEFYILTSMKGIGDNLAARFIAEVGDTHRFHNASALIAYAGIDAPAYQSGQFNSINRRISKRGSKSLRKVGYEIIASFSRQKPTNNKIYDYVKKKESEGKPKKVAKIAGLNKFFHIYYAKVRDAYITD